MRIPFVPIILALSMVSLMADYYLLTRSYRPVYPQEFEVRNCVIKDGRQSGTVVCDCSNGDWISSDDGWIASCGK